MTWTWLSAGLSWTVLGGALLGAASLIYFTLRLGIGPMPSSARARERLLSAIPPDTRGEIHELGSGWGHLAFPLARRFPGCTVMASELSWVPYLLSRLLHRLRPLENLELHRRDFFQAPLHRARVVVCYLFPGAMERLKAKLAAELPAGALVVTNTFALRGWEPWAVHELGDLFSTRIYVYRMPASR